MLLKLFAYLFCRSNLTMNSAQQTIILLFLKQEFMERCCSQEFHTSNNSSKTWVPFPLHKITRAEQTRMRMWQLSFSILLIFIYSHLLWLSEDLISSDSSLIISWVPGPCRTLSLILTYSSLLNVFLLFFRPLMLRPQWPSCWWPKLAAYFLILSSAQFISLAQNSPQE